MQVPPIVRRGLPRKARKCGATGRSFAIRPRRYVFQVTAGFKRMLSYRQRGAALQRQFAQAGW
jgi:hypothetical protein